MIHDGEAGVTVDLEGKEIRVGEEYQVGKIGLAELFNMSVKALKESEFVSAAQKLSGDNVDYGKFFDMLQRGDPFAVGLAIGSAVLGGMIAYSVLSIFTGDGSSCDASKEDDEKEPPPPLRDFTIDQLREFNGEGGKPIYIGMCGEVFDCSDAVDFYGPGNAYNCFAGRDSTRAMARLSFEEEDLSNPSVEGLGAFERSTLDDWYQKFKYYKCYPVVGKVSKPAAPQNFTKDELFQFRGLQPVDADSGRVDAPIYMAIKGQVLDVSYGGKEMYGEGGPYFKFAGKDASRALGKMSFEPADIDSSDLSDLTEQQLKTLDDWERKFIESKKYPVVGKLVDK